MRHSAAPINWNTISVVVSKQAKGEGHCTG
jgi:hypothetical protein